MSDKIIKVEGLSKRYRIGTREKADTFAEQLKNTITYPFKNFRRITNLSKFNGENDPSVFWALRDINFEVSRGEVLGIIGHNGAGKSTLLKILSRITEPTQGQITIQGRVSSLLEVGTGFHPELTGRDNVYMNGTILGMRKKEIDNKFDEIVAFSGVEQHIDTPVKFYSSGMTVRLAFSVAAHLEPEILIIDEVLAVGDAEFQKKCLGKMEDVAGQGRTVLFVSHNMPSVKKLCQTGILLKNGQIVKQGAMDSVSSAYMYSSDADHSNLRRWSGNSANNMMDLISCSVSAKGRSVDSIIYTSDELLIEICFVNEVNGANIDITFDIHESSGVHLCHIGMICEPEKGLECGKHKTFGVMPANLLNSKVYILDVLIGINQSQVIYREKSVLRFEIFDDIDKGRNNIKLPGVIHPICEWRTEKI